MYVWLVKIFQWIRKYLKIIKLDNWLFEKLINKLRKRMLERVYDKATFAEGIEYLKKVYLSTIGPDYFSTILFDKLLTKLYSEKQAKEIINKACDDCITQYNLNY